MRKINIIGSGFSSLSAACHLAKRGYQVEVFEKNSSLGGRARQFQKDGFTLTWVLLGIGCRMFLSGFCRFWQASI